MTREYKTLGDIAEELKVMKAQGVTRGAILYALGRVYWEDTPPQYEEPQAKLSNWQEYREWQSKTGDRTTSFMYWMRKKHE